MRRHASNMFPISKMKLIIWSMQNFALYYHQGKWYFVLFPVFPVFYTSVWRQRKMVSVHRFSHQWTFRKQSLKRISFLYAFSKNYLYAVPIVIAGKCKLTFLKIDVTQIRLYELSIGSTNNFVCSPLQLKNKTSAEVLSINGLRMLRK